MNIVELYRWSRVGSIALALTWGTSACTREDLLPALEAGVDAGISPEVCSDVPDVLAVLEVAAVLDVMAVPAVPIAPAGRVL